MADAAVRVFTRIGGDGRVVVVVRILVAMGVVVLVVVGRGMGVCRRQGRRHCHARGPPSTPLAVEHPATDDHDRDGRHDRRGAHDEVGRQDIGGPDDHGGKHEDPDRVREADREAKSQGMGWRPARADEIGRHQRLAVARRQGVAGA